MSTEPLMTAEEYAHRPDPGYPEELVRGRIVPMPQSNRRHVQICANAVYLFRRFLEDHASVTFSRTTPESSPSEPPTRFAGRMWHSIPMLACPEALRPNLRLRVSRVGRRSHLAKRPLAQGAGQGGRIPRNRSHGRPDFGRRAPLSPPLPSRRNHPRVRPGRRTRDSRSVAGVRGRRATIL